MQSDAKPNRGELSEDKYSENSVEIRMERAIRSSGLLAFLSPEELQTLMALLTFVDESGRCDLSSRTLGQSLNLSEKQAQKRLKKLCMLRWHGKALVAKESGRERGRFRPTGYQFMPAEGLRVTCGASSDVDMTDRGGSGDHGVDDGKVEKEADIASPGEEIGEPGKRNSGWDTPPVDPTGEGIDNTGNNPVADNNPVSDDACVVAGYKEYGKENTTKHDRGVVDGGVGDCDLSAENCGIHDCEKREGIPAKQNGKHDEKKLILNKLLKTGITRSIAIDMLETYPLDRVARQIQMLRFRNAKEPAAMLVKAIREDWAAPDAYMAKVREEAKKKSKMETEAREAKERRIWQQRVDAEKAKLSEGELGRITETARKNVRQRMNGVLHGKAPESLVNAEVNRMIANRYMSHGGT